MYARDKQDSIEKEWVQPVSGKIRLEMVIGIQKPQRKVEVSFQMSRMKRNL